MHKIVTLPVVTVASAGTAVKLQATPSDVKAVIIQGDPSNTGNVYVGDSTVSASNGFALGTKDSLTITPDGSTLLAELDISTLYVDADNSGSKVRVVYLF